MNRIDIVTEARWLAKRMDNGTGDLVPIADLLTRLANEVEKLRKLDAVHGEKPTNAFRHIRKHIFHVTQTEFAQLAGVVQATVSRWENGVAPSLDEMQAIRLAAAERGLEWDDRWFFEVPILR